MCMTRGTDTPRRLFLPAVLTLAFLLASIGARAAVLTHSGSDRPRPRAVIESQIKAVEEQLVKVFPAVDRCAPTELPTPSSCRLPFIDQQTDIVLRSAAAAIPSRAPPLL